MGTFLQIVGAIFTTFIVLILVALFGGKFWLKRKLNQLNDEVHKATREQDSPVANRPEQGNVIEGEFEVKEK